MLHNPRPPQPMVQELHTEAEGLQATTAQLSRTLMTPPPLRRLRLRFKPTSKPAFQTSSQTCSATLIRWMDISRRQLFFRGRVTAEGFNPRRLASTKGPSRYML